MTEYPERAKSRPAGWTRRSGAFSAVLLLTVLAGHYLGLVITPVFLWVLAIVAFVAALALLFAAFGFSQIWKYGDRGGKDIVVGVLIAALVLTPYGVAAYWATIYPQLRDISTDLDDPPALVAAAAARTGDMNVLAATPTPGERRLQAENYPLVTGRRYDLPFDGVLDAVETVLTRRGWALFAPLPDPEGKSEVTIEAAATSLVMALPADIAIRVTEDGDSTLVDMRSASRYGRHDLGDNAARIVAFLTELDQEINAQAGSAVSAP